MKMDYTRNNIQAEIENFILYFTSDEKERKEMAECLNDYFEEVWECEEE